MDPHDVLGIAPGASPDEVTRAYRSAAKRHHPDTAGEAAVERMREINAAYAQLRDQVVAGAAAEPARPGAPGAPGAWLAPEVRLALGPELLRALDPGEEVRVVTGAATWDAHDVRLVLTDRRLLWLRDDALTDRIRWVRLDHVTSVRARPGRRGRPGALRVHVREGRRVDFAEVGASALAGIARLVSAGTATA